MTGKQHMGRKHGRGGRRGESSMCQCGHRYRSHWAPWIERDGTKHMEKACRFCECEGFQRDLVVSPR
jgi:hypothetical protein